MRFTFKSSIFTLLAILRDLDERPKQGKNVFEMTVISVNMV